jgi:hypothetical protein
MLQALKHRPAGRRPRRKSDPEKNQLQHRVTHLEKQLRRYEQKEKLRAALKKLESRAARDSAKNNAR